MKHIVASIALCACLTFGSAQVVLAQDTSANITKKSIFQSFLSAPRSFFKKIFNFSNVPAVPSFQNSTSTVSYAPVKAETGKTESDSKKENAIKKQTGLLKNESAPLVQASKPASIVVPPSSASVPVNPANKLTSVTGGDVQLTIVTKEGGLVYNSDQTVACSNLETCKKTYQRGTKLALNAIAKAGYYFTGWSEASCGTSPECTIKMTEDIQLYANFKALSTLKRTGRILSPIQKETCYIKLGQNKCELAVYWINDTGLDMKLNLDEQNYVIGTQDKTVPEAKIPINPDIVPEKEPSNAIGPVFFSLEQGDHTLRLTSAGALLDSVDFKVACKPGSTLNQYGCWKDGAKKLYIFKESGVLVKSDPEGIACGYREGTCLVAYEAGTKVTLTADSVDGRSFRGWYGDCEGQGATCTLILDKDKSTGVVNK